MQGMKRKEVLQAMRREIPMADVLLRYAGLRPTRGMYQCLLHDDQHPSASINKRYNKLHCFQCQAHLSIFDIVMKCCGLDFTGALTLLAKDYGYTIPGWDGGLNTEQMKAIRDRQEDRELEQALEKKSVGLFLDLCTCRRAIESVRGTDKDHASLHSLRQSIDCALDYLDSTSAAKKLQALRLYNWGLKA